MGSFFLCWGRTIHTIHESFDGVQHFLREKREQIICNGPKKCPNTLDGWSFLFIKEIPLRPVSLPLLMWFYHCFIHPSNRAGFLNRQQSRKSCNLYILYIQIFIYIYDCCFRK